MTWNDLKLGFMRLIQSVHKRKGFRNEFRKNSFLSNNGICLSQGISKMCSEIQRGLQGSVIFMLGSVPVHGLRTAYLSGKPAGHRSLPVRPEQKALPYGNKWTAFAKHHSICERKQGLEDLRRFCKHSYSYCKTFICGRRNWSRAFKYRICSGFHNYRLVSGTFPLGEIPHNKGCGENAYSAGSAWLNTIIHRYNRGESPRCEYSRPYTCRTGIILYYGSCLSRFLKALFNNRKFCLLCDSNQEGISVQKTIFTSSRQISRTEMRSDNYAYRLLSSEILSFTFEANQILRQGKRLVSYIFNKQFLLDTSAYSRSLWLQMANRAVLQMDQTASEDKVILWYFRKRGENSNLDCCIRVCPGGNNEKETQPATQPLHNSTDFKFNAFRESPCV